MYDLHVIATNLQDHNPALLTLAPKKVAELFKKASAAEVAYIAAELEAREAAQAVPIEQAAYLAAVEQAVITGTETPQPLAQVRAEARQRVTARQAKDAEAALEGLRREIGALLSDPETCNAWITAATEKAETLKADYLKAIDDVEAKARTYSELIGLTYSLGQLGTHVLLPVKVQDPAGDLRKVADWQPFRSGVNITA